MVKTFSFQPLQVKLAQSPDKSYSTTNNQWKKRVESWAVPQNRIDIGHQTEFPQVKGPRSELEGRVPVKVKIQLADDWNLQKHTLNPVWTTKFR